MMFEITCAEMLSIMDMEIEASFSSVYLIVLESYFFKSDDSIKSFKCNILLNKQHNISNTVLVKFHRYHLD